MTVETHYIALKEMLKSKPKKLESQSDWLLVLANTMRAMVVNTDKCQLAYLDSLLVKGTSQELKLAFDFCQGRFGGNGFSYRRHPNYLYLCSLVATFPEFEVSSEDQAYLKEVIGYNHYLLYDID
ncbi:hypothetical protein AB6M97_00210 [Streptococcus hillyeri]|uniref:Uncharacterized protein n=1 Tax=Streptococcus hillyeri TaxID=2282420 RepID=A0A3L9DU12_9STRE|nr:hypothetical protein [Streptococcus hillyeri]RLY02652.1 hypothetical protein EAF07_07030 [Streptococcus hillyeri]